MNEFELYNKKYSLMKAKMIRQGLWTANFASKIEAQPETNAAIKRRMTMSAGASAMQPNSSKGFATTDMTIGDPSLKKMKEEISIKEQKNQELTDEIKRLKHRLQGNVGSDDMVKELMKELSIKEQQMQGRDQEIDDLLGAKENIEKEKLELQRQIEQMKS